MSLTAEIEYKGKVYEVKYTFSIIRRLRSEGINVPVIYRKIATGENRAIDFGDEIAYVVAWLLRSAGCEDVTDEHIWRECMTDPERLKQVFAVFKWVCDEH